MFEIFKSALVIFSLSLAFIQCKQEQSHYDIGSGSGDSARKQNNHVNNQGDTIITGVSLPITGTNVPARDLAPPAEVLLRGKPLATSINAHIYPVGQPSISVLKPWKKAVPGESGLLLSKVIKTTGQSVRFKYPNAIRAKNPEIRKSAVTDIQLFSVGQGLTVPRVWSVYEDSRGYLWIGTIGGGVLRYDGKHFIPFTENEGLSSNDIRAILEDRYGNLWFGTNGGGISRYDGQNIIKFTTENGLSHNFVQALLEDQLGNIWIGTFGGGINKFDPTTNTITQFTGSEDLDQQFINSIFEDSQGNVWFGSRDGGVSMYNGSAFLYIGAAQGLQHHDVRTIAEDHQGKIWLGTYGGGVIVLDPGTHPMRGEQYTVREGLHHDQIMAIKKDRRNRMWIGSDGGGVCLYDGASFAHYTTREGLSNNIILSICEDSGGNVWLGSWGNGLIKFGNDALSYNMLSDFLSTTDVRSIIADKQGYIWLGTWGSGLIRFDGRNFISYTVKEGLSDNNIYDLFEDRNGYLWIGTRSKGVSRFDGKRFVNYNTKQGLCGNAIFSITEDLEGHLWFGSWGSGLSKFDGTAFTTYSENEGLINNIVMSLAKDHDGGIWLGTYGGGIAHLEKDSIIYYTKSEGLSDNFILSVRQDQHGYLWIGTNGNGLNRFDDQKFTRYDTEHGLPNTTIVSLLEAEKLWVGTQGGISQFIDDQNNDRPNMSFLTLGKENGLRYYNFSVNAMCLDEDNGLWMGSSDGIVKLDLNKFSWPKDTPRIRISSLDIQQKPVDYRQLTERTDSNNTNPFIALAGKFENVKAFQNYPVDLSLPYQLNHLTFHFSAIDWRAPESVEFSYFLQGWDQFWSSPNRDPIAQYRNLPPGRYRLKVKAKNQNGYWSESLDFPFRIHPPLWRTWWAYSLYVLIFLSALYGLYQYQKKRWLLKAALEKEQEASVRLKELDEFKSRFYANITHEFRTPLTVIQGLADQLRENPRWKTTEFIELIKRNSQKLLQLINQMLDLSKLEAGKLAAEFVQGDVIAYLNYLIESFHSLGMERQVAVSFHSEVDRLVMDFDPEKYQQIIDNLITNALKFTPEYGKVKVVVKKGGPEDDPKWLQVSVQDTGIGIAKEDLPFIFDRFYQADNSSIRKEEGTGLGLALIKELVELMGGAIRVNSETGRGTTFILRLPVHRQAPLASDLRPAGDLTGKGLPPLLAATGRYPDRVLAEDAPLVLLVEDNPDVITYLRTCLEDWYRLLESRNGREGLAKAQEVIPDLVISDVMMPEMDGFELCKALKTDERTNHIPVVLLTAKATQIDRIAGLSRGADAYLAKPFEKEELLVRLEQLMELRRQLQKKYQAGKQPDKVTEDLFLTRIRKIVLDQLDDTEFGVQQLSRAVGMSRVQVHRKLKALIGQPASEVIRTIRLQRAYELLKDPDLTIAEVGYQVGYKDPAHFSRSFSQRFGVAPSEMRGS